MKTTNEFKTTNNLTSEQWRNLRTKAEKLLNRKISTRINNTDWMIDDEALGVLEDLLKHRQKAVEAQLVDVEIVQPNITSLAVVEPSRRAVGSPFALSRVVTETENKITRTELIQENLLQQVQVISEAMQAYRNNLLVSNEQEIEQVTVLEQVNATLEAEINLTRRIEAQQQVESDFLAQRKKLLAQRNTELQSLLV